MFGLIDRAVIWASAVLVALLMAAMTGATVLGVFFRYILEDALPWPEEFSRYAMIWVGMVGSGLVIRYGGHVAIDLLYRNLRGYAALAVRILIKLLVLIFLVIILYYGVDMTKRVERQTAAALRISMSIPYLAVPVGAVLMIYHLIVLTLRREDTGREAPHLPTE